MRQATRSGSRTACPASTPPASNPRRRPNALHRIDVGAGDHCLVVVDVQSERQARAAALGAGTLDEHTAPFTHVVETTGYPSVLTQYTDRIADAAKISLVGISTGTIGLDYRTVVRRQLTLSGSLIYDHPVGFARVIDSVVSGNVVPARTIDAQYDFDDTSTAFSRARAVGGKSVFLF
jgi:threonine dehydrogenase-like Zn-dependent dehydrogenase